MSRPKVRRLIRAVSNGWEVWRLPDSFPPELESFSEENEPPVPESQTIVALPGRFVNIYPLWLHSDDPAVLSEMAEIQLSAIGLLRAATPVVRLIRSESGRSLVTAIVLHSDPHVRLCAPEAAEFIASPECENLPPDAAVIWEEVGQRLIAFTSGEVPVYWESRRVTEPDEIAGDLACLLTRLTGEGVMGALNKIVLRIPSTAEFRAQLKQHFQVDVVSEERPSPRIPSQDASRVVPSSVVQKRLAVQRKKLLLRVASLAGFLIFGLVGLLFGRQELLVLENAKMKRVLDAEEPRVTAVSNAQLQWATLRPAIDPDLYPVERLLQLALLMPTDGLRLTVFEQSIEAGELRVLIIGEVSSPQAAFSFSESVRTHPAWRQFRWQIPQPTILPNNAAQFRMEGTFLYASSL